MGDVYPEINDKISAWIERQRLFFVATAPSGKEGHINLSPKGAMETFAILGPNRVAYADMVGSGIETVSHLRDNGRIVIMFCAFEGPPQIVRFHGQGRVVEQRDPRFPELRAAFDLSEQVATSLRSIIEVDVERVSDSCGFVVPRMHYDAEREQLYKFAETQIKKHGPDAIRDYADVNNTESIDGLPGLTPFSEPDEKLVERHDHRGRKL